MADILLPLPSGTERDLLLQQALADSARDLSVDERYILRRLASVVARAVPTGSHVDVLVSLPVAEFATHAGLSKKVARRRLDVATHVLFNRRVKVVSEDTETSIAWVGSHLQSQDFFDLIFSGFFVQHLLSVLRPWGEDEPLGFVEFDGAAIAPAVLCRGNVAPYGLPVVLTSRLKSRKMRPKVMSLSHVLRRVEKRLKGNVERGRIDDVLDLVIYDSPWRGMEDSKYYKFTHRDLHKMHKWTLTKMNEPGFAGQ